MARSKDPLFGEVPERVLLGNAPLVRVLGQATFPKIVKISEESYIGDFQEAIRDDYPHLQRDNIQSVEVNVDKSGMQHQTTETVVWRFFDLERIVRVSLGTDAITLETAKYVSRKEFMKQLKIVLDALSSTIKPAAVTRVGFRYVDRIQGGKNLGSLSKLIRPELLNILQPNLLQHIEFSMTNITCITKEGKLIVRYGMAPPKFTHDPDMAPPVENPSWVLDIDSFSTKCEGSEFEPNLLCKGLNEVAARAYAFFRWGITDEFLQYFGVTEK